MTRNELIVRLAKRAVAIIAPCLREEEQRDAFDEFCWAFDEEFTEYEAQEWLGRAGEEG